MSKHWCVMAHLVVPGGFDERAFLDASGRGAGARGVPPSSQHRHLLSVLMSPLSTSSSPGAADTFSEQAFLDAMTVVLAHAVYLPAAQCFAIAPAVHRMRRSGDPTAAALDYDAGSGAVVLTANRSYG